MNVHDTLSAYIPYSEQEKKDQEFIIKCLNTFDDILTRNNEFCQVCSSAFIINKEHNKVLSTYHKIYDSWTWTGGHVDGENNLEFVAEKEAREETGINKLKLLLKLPVSIDTLPVMGHFKKGKYVSAHIHLSFAYLYEADENEDIRIKEDENSEVKWLIFDELLEKSTEPHMKKVYEKIIIKLKELDKA